MGTVYWLLKLLLAIFSSKGLESALMSCALGLFKRSSTSGVSGPLALRTMAVNSWPSISSPKKSLQSPLNRALRTCRRPFSLAS